jgi:hypothetical protein
MVRVAPRLVNLGKAGNGAYYASADAFYNNGQSTGSLIGAPFLDPTVPNC